MFGIHKYRRGVAIWNKCRFGCGLIPLLKRLSFVLGYEDTDFDTIGKQLGMWRNVGTLKWTVNKDFTKTKDTGPSRDHTTGNGNLNMIMKGPLSLCIHNMYIH